MNLRTVQLFLVFILMAFISESYAQKDEIFKKIKTQSYDTDWVLFLENDDVKLSTMYSDCSDPSASFKFEYLLLKIENKTNSNVAVSWQWDYSYNNEERTEESDDEIYATVLVSAGGMKQSACIEKEGKKHRLFVRDKSSAGSSVLTDFSINNLKVLKY